MAKKNPNWGGKRPGAGRKRSSVKIGGKTVKIGGVVKVWEYKAETSYTPCKLVSANSNGFQLETDGGDIISIEVPA